jgi:hypothetical protein
MGQSMKRYFLLVASACLGGVLAAGCQHIGGKHDCGYHPSDYVLPAPSLPYPSAPAPGTQPPKAKADGSVMSPDPLPRTSDAGY